MQSFSNDLLNIDQRSNSLDLIIAYDQSSKNMLINSIIKNIYNIFSAYPAYYNKDLKYDNLITYYGLPIFNNETVNHNSQIYSMIKDCIVKFEPRLKNPIVQRINSNSTEFNNLTAIHFKIEATIDESLNNITLKSTIVPATKKIIVNSVAES